MATGGSQGQKVPGEGAPEWPVVVRSGRPGESAAEEDPVKVGHEGHRRLGGEQPLGGSVGENDTVGRAAADVCLKRPVGREREHEQAGRLVVRGFVAPLLAGVLEVAPDGVTGMARAFCLDDQRISRC